MSLDDFLDEGPRTDATSPVSAIAAKSADLEAFRKSIEDSAGVSGGLWLSYLFVLFYLGIAAGAVTHADLLLENPVKLPFLNIELPLLAFFFLAPLLFIITHAYTLVNLSLLADRVRQFHQKLGDQFAADPALEARASEIRSALTRQLPSNIFVQFLGGPDEIRKGAFGRSLAFILWVTLVVAPVALLLMLQIQFLPYHSWWIVWINRIALVLDLGLIWWLWGKILGSRVNHPKAHLWRYAVNRSIAVLLTVCIILFACIIATIPGEWQEDHLPYRAASNSVRGWVFAGNVNDTTRRRTSLFSNTLVLPGFNIYEALKIEDPKKVEWKQHLVDLRGRDLQSAVLDGAVLSRADLTGTWLQGASLTAAKLQGASLFAAKLQRARLYAAELQGADLSQAHLQGADLTSAQLQGADLSYALLHVADLSYAQLQGADLMGAELQGAFLGTAELEAADFTGTVVWGTVFPKRDAAKDIWGKPETAAKSREGCAGDVVMCDWGQDAYAALKSMVENEASNEFWRLIALRKIAILEKRPDADGEIEARNWTALFNPNLDRGNYLAALATALQETLCSADGSPDAIAGLLIDSKFGNPGFARFKDNAAQEIRLAEGLLDDSKCPGARGLAEESKAKLRKIGDATKRRSVVGTASREGSKP